MINKIKEDIKQAMRDKNKEKLLTLRMLMATIDNERIKLKEKELNDDDVIVCINRNLKQLGQEIDSLIKANRNIDDAMLQAEILKEYLPKQMTEEEIECAVEEAVSMVVGEGGSFGVLMGYLSANLKGKADMKLVSQIAKDEWSER